jgi:hypothetical protein
MMPLAVSQIMIEEVQNEFSSVKMLFLNTFGLSFWSSSECEDAFSSHFTYLLLIYFMMLGS